MPQPHVEVVEYDPAWPARFRHESEALEPTLSRWMARSTAPHRLHRDLVCRRALSQGAGFTGQLGKLDKRYQVHGAT
jgi:hypothetical protein